MKLYIIPIILILLITPALAQECKTDEDCPKLRCPGMVSKCINGECITPRCLQTGMVQEVTTSLVILLQSKEVLGYDINQLKTTYNQNINKVPWIVKKIIGNERINLYLTTNTGQTIIVGAKTKSARILTIKEGEIEKPTLNIYITEGTINRLKNQEITIQQAIKTKEIKYKSQRIRTSVKMWFTKRALNIASWFKR